MLEVILMLFSKEKNQCNGLNPLLQSKGLGFEPFHSQMKWMKKNHPCVCFF
jgi:hypothetical protein